MLKLILMVVIGVLALSFFGISLRSIVESPIGQQNFAFVADVVVASWHFLIDLLRGLTGSVGY